MPDAGRDRLRELLDVVVDGTDVGRRPSLTDMAAGVGSSRFHFAHLVSAATGEPPAAMRRRIMLERAAWQLLNGASVTETAFEAGYESVDGFGRAFSRAFGHPPSTQVAGYWLPAPNGIHFHPPAALWLHSKAQVLNPGLEMLVAHDLDDTRHLLELAKGLPVSEYRAVRLPGMTLLSWHGPEESIAAVLENHVWTKQVWVAAIQGADAPVREEDADAIALLERHDAVAPRWLAAVRDVERRSAWNDTIIDALCDPPESFPLGAVVAHVLTHAAGRRQVARVMLRAAGHEVDDGDPIDWVRAQSGALGG